MESILLLFLSNQLQFLVMFKSFVHPVFHIGVHFHRFSSQHILNWRASRLGPSSRQIFAELQSQRISGSLPAVIQTWNSAGRAALKESKHRIDMGILDGGVTNT
jgi:hypothetical protein